MRRPVPGKLIGRHSLSKGPKGREHILAVSWNLHQVFAAVGSTVGEWGHFGVRAQGGAGESGECVRQ